MIKVSIPATTANLGPGFDCIGLALNLRNTFSVALDENPGGVRVTVAGEGESRLPQDAKHLVAQTMIDETWPGVIPQDRGIHIHCENAIPVASGLGSSSTALLAGLIFSSALSARSVVGDDPAEIAKTVKSEVNMNRVLRRAIKLEGHGDNVAPALLGGLILVVPGEELVIRSVEFAPLKVVVCVPEFDFLTTVARAALPVEYPKADTIFNIGHVTLLVEALRTGDAALLRSAVRDRVHEPYRLPLIPGAKEAREAALDAGAITTCMSGAGPGQLAFADSNHEQIGQAMVQAFSAVGLRARAWVLDAVREGTEVFASN